ncbi:MAG: hypothetical protein WDZ26_05975 [Nitriliruptoraceae bacterium]
MATDDAPFSPDVLLRRAAAGDAARVREVLATIGPSRLLDAVMTQAELAVDDERPRVAGIDAMAELDRAAIEVMDLPQGAGMDDVHAFPSDGQPIASPTLVGWELVTVPPSRLEGATMSIAARPWQLALVAFADSVDRRGTHFRRVVAAAADGRMVAGQLRFDAQGQPTDLLDAIVTRSTADLVDDEQLAVGLLAALRECAHGA